MSLTSLWHFSVRRAISGVLVLEEELAGPAELRSRVAQILKCDDASVVLLVDCEMLEHLWPPATREVDVSVFLDMTARSTFLEEVVQGNIKGARPTSFWKLRSVVSEAVTINGNCLAWASERLRGDEEVVMAAVRTSVSSLKFAAAGLLKEESFALRVVRIRGSALGFLPSHNGKLAVVMAAVERDAHAIQYASPELLQDSELAHKVVKRRGNALKFFSGDVRDNFEVVKTAVKREAGALQWASRRLQKDPAIVSIAARRARAATERLT